MTQITKKSLIAWLTKNDQFEKVAEAIPTAVFYNEAGEEVEKVKLEGLSRFRGDGVLMSWCLLKKIL